MARAVQQDAEQEVYSPVDLKEILSTLEKVVKIQSITIGEENRCSTGSICLDLVLGGGLTAGMYTWSGAEQSAKTTLAIMMLAASVNQDVGLRVLWDAEGSSGSSMDYVENVFETQGVHADMETLFGVRKKGKYVVTPMIYYRDEGEMDTFYNWLSGLLRRLPDKRFEAERWWFVYEPTPENKAKYKGRYDRNLSAANNGLYIPAPSGALQAMVLIDSYPGLNPPAMDDDDPKSGMALQAREFSKNIPRIKGRLRSKRVALIGINQIRKAPGVMFTDPNYEPGGEALKYFCMSADTLLLTEKGMVTANEYFHGNTGKLPKICGQGGLEKPGGFKSTGYSEIRELLTDNGFYLRGKPGHKVLTLIENELVPSFKTLEQVSSVVNNQPHKNIFVALKVGANVFPTQEARLEFTLSESTLVRAESTREKVIIPTRMSPRLAYVAGLLVGDGFVRGGTVHLVNMSAAVHESFGKICSEEFNVVVTRNGPKKVTAKAQTSSFFSAAVGQFLAHIGLGENSSFTKSVPWPIRQGTREIQAAFLAGHYDTDKLGTTSKVLSEQLRLMLLNFGVLSGKVKKVRENFHDRNKEFDPSKSYARLDTFGNPTYGRQGFYSVPVYPPYLEVLDEIISPYSMDKDAQARRDKRLIKSGVYQDLRAKKLGDSQRALPVSDKPWRKPVCGLLKVFNELKSVERKTLRSGKLYLDVRARPQIGAMRDIIDGYRTPQEKVKARTALDSFESLLDFVEKDGLVFVKVDSVSHMKERSMTYDGNMPDTSTFVTNGIISHNSDVRLRSTPRALSGVPFKPVGKGQIEKEPSLSGEGEDTYRYIHLKAIKNKLSVPNRETWLRIWVQDDSAKARGFCPVWDTFYALSMTGQVSGKRTSMLLDVHGLGPAKKNIAWTEFKRLILGSKEDRAEVCKKLGYRPINLRNGMFGLMRKGVLEDLYAEQHKTALKKAKAKAAKAAEDEDDDEEDDDI